MSEVTKGAIVTSRAKPESVCVTSKLGWTFWFKKDRVIDVLIRRDPLDTVWLSDEFVKDNLYNIDGACVWNKMQNIGAFFVNGVAVTFEDFMIWRERELKKYD